MFFHFLIQNLGGSDYCHIAMTSSLTAKIWRLLGRGAQTLRTLEKHILWNWALRLALA